MILPVQYEAVEQYKEEAEKDGVIFGKNLYWFMIYKVTGPILNEVCGFGALSHKKRYSIHKCDYIFPKYRGKGLHTKLTIFKNDLCKDKEWIEANCTPAAVKTHLNQGAVIDHKYKNGITKIKYI